MTSFETTALPSAAAPAELPDLTVSMIVLGVSDLARSAKFYRETLELSAVPAPGDLPMLRAGNLIIVLNGALSGCSGVFELVFPVESVGSIQRQLTDRGCHLVANAREVAKDMWAATFTDPDGHRLTLFGAS